MGSLKVYLAFLAISVALVNAFILGSGASIRMQTDGVDHSYGSRNLKDQNIRKVIVMSGGQPDPEPIWQIFVPVIRISRPHRPRPHYNGHNNYYHHHHRHRPYWYRPHKEYYNLHRFGPWREFDGYNVTVENYVTNNITVNTILNNTGSSSARSFMLDPNIRNWNEESNQVYSSQPFQLLELITDEDTVLFPA